MPRQDNRHSFPLNWRLLRHILALYRDINLALQEINTNATSNSNAASIFKKIINRLKAINTLGDNVSWYFFLHIQLSLYLSGNSIIRNSRQLKRFLVSVRNALEKMIVSKGTIRLLRRKDVFVNLRNPTVSIFVPEGFEDLIPGYRYIPGTLPVILTAPHASPPQSDINTGKLALVIAKRTSAYALISNLPRFIADPNRVLGRVWPFRRILEQLIAKRKIKLIIDLHTSSSTREHLVEIGTWYGFSIPKKYLDMLMQIFDSNDVTYGTNSRFVGGDITFYHSNIPLVSTVQLEISGEATRRDLRRIIRALVKFIKKFSGVKSYGGLHRKS